VWRQTHYDITYKNNISFEKLNKHNHSSYQTHCDTSDNVCLDLHNYQYSIYKTNSLGKPFFVMQVFKLTGEDCSVRMVRVYQILVPIQATVL
jgi:hypothetical protein